MRKSTTKVGNSNSGNVFAAPAPQEMLGKILQAAKKLNIGERIKFSSVGCAFGLCGVYAEFKDEKEKEAFLNLIGGMFDAAHAWAW